MEQINQTQQIKSPCRQRSLSTSTLDEAVSIIHQRYGTNVALFKKRFAPVKQIKMARFPEECVVGDYPSLARLNKAYPPNNHGGNNAIAWLMIQVAEMCVICGVKEKLNEYQQEWLCNAIYEEFYYLKVTEIMLFFHRFKCGRYKHLYGSVDPTAILESLAMFKSERNEIITNYERKQLSRKATRDIDGAQGAYQEYLRRKQEKEKQENNGKDKGNNI